MACISYSIFLSSSKNRLNRGCNFTAWNKSTLTSLVAFSGFISTDSWL